MFIGLSMLLTNSLQWRSALKTFVPIAPEQVNVKPILESIRWAPSAFGVQPYHVHVVTDSALKAKLRTASYDQPQVTECSHLLVFCARNDAAAAVERFITHCDIDNLAPRYAKSVRAGISHMDQDACRQWASNQAFIGLGMGLAAAADQRIGSCPMSGFVPADVHKVLQLPDNQWPVCYLAIGSHLDTGDSENRDPVNKNERIRFRLPSEELFQFHT